MLDIQPGDIVSFREEHGFLSNFHPCKVHLDGVEYPSVEHAYQAAKTLDHEARVAIRQAETAAQAKRLGRKVSSLRPDWRTYRDTVMLLLLREKFQLNGLKAMLAHTWPRRLIHGNTWHDNYWGACMCTQCQLLPDPSQDKLGQFLQALRGEIRSKDPGLASAAPVMDDIEDHPGLW